MTGNGSKETLADFVRRIRREKKLSLNAVAQRSGGSITNAYISKIENDLTKKQISLIKLAALAKGLGVHEEEVFLVAGAAQPKIKQDRRFTVMGFKYANLPPNVPAQRRKRIEAIIEVLDQLLDEEQS